MQFIKRSIATIAAASCSSLLISGFPFLFSLTSAEPLGASSGVLFAAVSLTRAPLLIPLGVYQLPLLGALSSRRAHVVPLVVRTLVIIVCGGCIITAAAGMLGPMVLSILFGNEFLVSNGLIAALTGAAVCMVALTLTGMVLLVRERHRANTIGWVLAAVVTGLTLALPLPLNTRAVIALYAGPMTGMAAHLLGLRRAAR
jgi:hypothetical protein